jgi:hypothetical protein
VPIISLFAGMIMSNWEKMKAGQPLDHIQPLE